MNPLYGSDLASVGDVVTGDVVATAYGVVRRSFVGRVVSTFENGSHVSATTKLDDGTIVRCSLESLTVIERHTGPAAGIERWALGWALKVEPTVDYTSARSVLGRADAWSQWCDAWWAVSCVMRDDFFDADEEDEGEYEPMWSELGMGSASLGGAL